MNINHFLREPTNKDGNSAHNCSDYTEILLFYNSKCLVTMSIRNDDEYFRTYSYRKNGTNFKIIPIIQRGGTQWEIRIFEAPNQGPTWSGDRLTKDVLEQHDLPDIPEGKLSEINEAVDLANDLLQYDTGYNREERGDASIDKLLELSDAGNLMERLNSWV